MENLICSFFGHRDVNITEALSKAVTDAIGEAIAEGCRVFYFGGYGDFDALCYQTVSELKASGMDIRRVYCVPRESYLNKRVRYFKREDYEDVIYLLPAFEGWYKSIYFRNLAMIDACAYLIFYAENREGSGAYKAYAYAKKKKNKTLVNLFDTRKNDDPENKS